MVSRVGGVGTDEQRCWICSSQSLLIALVWQEELGEMLCCFPVRFTASHPLTLICPICSEL